MIVAEYDNYDLSGQKYIIESNRLTVIDKGRKREDPLFQQTTCGSTDSQRFCIHREGIPKIYFQNEAGEIEMNRCFVNRSTALDVTIDVVLGIVQQYFNRVQRNGKFLDDKQLHQGLSSLGWKSVPNIKIVDNFVTNKPMFWFNDESIDLETLLLILIEHDEVHRGGV